jgi:AraC-like DNA-binding protein
MSPNIPPSPSPERGGDLLSARAICELFDHVEDVLFWAKEPEGHFIWANVALLIEFGMSSRDEIIGKTDYDIHPPHVAVQVLADDAAVLKGEPVMQRIEFLGRRDHTARWFVTCKVPLRGSGGRIVGTTGITSPMKADPDYWLEYPLGRVLGHMSQNFKEQIENEQFARMAGMSERTFERQFRKHYGVSPHQYLMRIRIQTSRHALVYTDQPIASIALDHGFADQSHFTREFHHQVGTTPAEYRRRFRQGAA